MILLRGRAFKYSGFWMLGLIQLAACSLSGPLREDVKASQFKLGKTPKTWTAQSPKGEKDTGGADAVFQDRSSQSLIAVNSVCFRYESTSLERLAHQFESGLKDSETLSEGEVTIHDRKGYRVHMKGSFDGVPSEILVIVLRKNDCLFDFSIVGKSPLGESLISTFDGWVQEFRYSQSTEKKGDE